MSKDYLYRYLFENASVRGELIQLEQSFQQIITNHDYPLVIKKLMGELLAATSLLTATLKLTGDIGIQLQGEGPVSLAVVNGNNQQQMRGVVRINGQLKDKLTLTELFGKGHIIITLTPDEGEAYQGVIALDKPTLAECLESYFIQSEQLPTKLWLFANEQQAGGMLLQVLPSNETLDIFDHLTQLTDTITQDEIFKLDAQTILHRLYHQESVRLFEAEPVTFACTCSKARCEAAIRSLSQQEIDDILAEKGEIDMQCQYCNQKYVFDAVDIKSIFINDSITSECVTVHKH